MNNSKGDALLLSAMILPVAAELVVWEAVSAYPALINPNTVPTNPLAILLGGLIAYVLAIVPVLAVWYIKMLSKRVIFSFIAFEAILYVLFWIGRMGWSVTYTMTQAGVQVFALVPTFLIIAISIGLKTFLKERVLAPSKTEPAKPSYP